MPADPEATSWLLSAPDGQLPPPPVETSQQVLPIGVLSPEDTERLFLRVLLAIEDVEQASLYGTPGQKQDGIDVYARLRLTLESNEAPLDYVTLQSKRLDKLTPALLRKAVSTFLKGKWVDRSARFYFATTHSLRPVALADELTEQTDRLAKAGVVLVPFGAEELSLELKELPRLVDDFFGREWVEIHCGPGARKSLDDRLDRVSYDRFRVALREFYGDELRLHAGGASASSLEILDVAPRERAVNNDTSLPDSSPIHVSALTDEDSIDRRFRPHTAVRRTRVLRDFGDDVGTEVRVPLDHWVADRRRTLLVGAAGTGKSTFLRFLAADLLSEEPRAADLMVKAGEQLPLWLPFSFLCKHLSESTSNSILSAVQAWFASHDLDELAKMAPVVLRDHRLFLIIDGVDEWTTADQARSALQLLESFLNASGARALLSTRPYAKGEIPRKLGWSEGHLAPLSRTQISRIVRRLVQGPDAKDVLGDIEASHEAASLARVPLFLALLIELHLAGQFQSTKLAIIDEFVSRFLAEMPRLRSTPSAAPLADDQIGVVVGELAWELRRVSASGFASVHDVRKLLIDILVRQFSLDQGTALQWAANVFDSAQRRFAVLVSHGADRYGFVHRLILEHLAGQHLAAQRLEVQEERFAELIDDPSWRDVLVAMISESVQRDALEVALLKRLGDSSGPVDQRWEFAAELLSARVELSTATTDVIVAGIADRIESSPWRAHRARLARSLGEAYGGPAFDEEMAERASNWLRGAISDPRTGLWASRHVDSSKEAAVRRTLLWGLRLPSWGVRITAADAFRVRYSSRPFDETVVESIRGEGDTEVQAVLLLAAGWAWKHDALAALVEWASQQPSMALRCVALNLRHRWGELNKQSDLRESDLNMVRRRLEGGEYDTTWLSLTNDLLPVVFPFEETEWRDSALNVLTGERYGNAARDVAYRLACGPFAADDRFRQWAVEEELRGEHPFLSFDARLVPTIWASDPEYEAAVIGGITRYSGHSFGGAGVEHIQGLPPTAALRDALLANLDTDRPTPLAYELWNQFATDEVVQDAMRTRLQSGPEVAGKYSYAATMVLGRSEGFARLVELARSAVSDKPSESNDALRNALATEWHDLKAVAGDTSEAGENRAESRAIVDSYNEDELATLCLVPKPTHIDWGIDDYFQAFAGTEGARARAREWLADPHLTIAQVPEILPGAILSGFGWTTDPGTEDILDSGFGLLRFLDVDIREMFIRGLGNSRAETKQLLRLAGHWQHDSDDACLRAWATVFGSRLREDLPSDIADTIRGAIHELLVRRGTRNEETRQAGWVAALAAADLSLLVGADGQSSPPSISLREKFVRHNEALIALIGSNWGELRNMFGSDLEGLIDAPEPSRHRPAQMWTALAGAPDKSPALEEDLRHAVRTITQLRSEPRVVQWAAAGEYSEEHLRLLLLHDKGHGHGNRFSDDAASLIRRAGAWTIDPERLSALLIGDEVPDARARAYSSCMSNDSRALHAELLPDHPVSKALLSELYEWFASDDRIALEWNWESVAGVSIGAIDAERLPDLLLRIYQRLRMGATVEMDVLAAKSRARLSSDPAAVESVEAAVRATSSLPQADGLFTPVGDNAPSGSQRVSLAFLLAGAGRLDPALLDWLAAHLPTRESPMIDPLTDFEGSIRIQLAELSDLVKPTR
ncbi:NACHT domain-containing NTPase [Cryobacterium sp. N22]|uniref:NACHT domain-containing protein n=1 Tax=Cryobacterium sp. N22 TaxID=2048290 RepID=UPI000CE3FB07|nr:NACHT domain-containing protein [Cryobacterium sp. N22]